MGSGNELIFVSIAAYRDIQLVPTVEDLLAKAHEPFLLRFGICWQHDADDLPLPFAGDGRFQILDVDWRASRGACWARAEIMKFWRGEQWFLQVDSHCRFAEGWDTKLIRMTQETGSPKPLLSTYAYPFTPREPEPGAGTDPDTGPEEDLSGIPQLMAIETFTDDGIPQLKPLSIADAAQRVRPMPARFLAAGFLFAPGTFVEDVPYDPELYFFGEEIAMTLRGFTSGYNLFHPVEQIVWHDYERNYARRHWDDHVPACSEEGPHGGLSWGERDRLSRQRIFRLLHPESAQSEDGSLGRFGLGTVRSLEEYERYAGISLSLRKIQDYTRHALEPPNPDAPIDWPAHIYTWLVRVIIDTVKLSADALSSCDFWMVAIQDGEHREIRRRDFTRQELVTLAEAEAQIVLLCEIQSGIIPAFWTVWPYSRSRGWMNRVDGALAADDFSIVDD